MFIIDIHYTAELSEIERHLAAHRDYLDHYYAQGAFLFSGRKEPREGGVIIARAANRMEIEKIVSEDPFYQANIGEYRITEFIPTKTAKELASFADKEKQ
ncbi:MAG: YciI family protein [Neisseria sp.]|uniref:YciI family protein n=1 Tax=Neisseria sp. TaxID=192066 RepID=UPI0026DB634B|nr:YciI family protein [Neisseria sp.]MDO4640265.1 YciI family protein [Neisseria sp.]